MQGRTKTLGFVAGAVASGLALTAVDTATDRSPAARDASARSARSAPAPATASAALAGLPLSFEENRGQTDASVRYMARGAGYTVFLRDHDSILSLSRGKHGTTTLRTRLIGATRTSADGTAQLPGVVNVYRGKQHTVGVPTFRDVRYAGAYPGIDLHYHGRQGRLEYDFEVSPRANPERIGLALSGARSVSVSSGGDLLVRVNGGLLRQRQPLAYQTRGGGRVRVPVSYRLSNGRIGFRVGGYDHSRKLTIDPVLSYSTYLGGTAEDRPQKIAVGPDGAKVITGYTKSNDFPSAGARTNARTDYDAFVTKLSASGSTATYSTYLGSATTTADDVARDVAIDSANRAYIVGTAGGSDFPQISPGVAYPLIDSCSDGLQDAFMTRLASTTGAIIYSTCIGGALEDDAYGVALRQTFASLPTRSTTTRIFVAGETHSTDFTGATDNGFQPARNTDTNNRDAFLAKINYRDDSNCGVTFGLVCASIPYRTFVGGDGEDVANGVAVEPLGANDDTAYLVGSTRGSFPSTIGSSGGNAGAPDAFAMKVNTAQAGAASKVWGTIIGGSSSVTSQDGLGIAVSGAAAPYVVGTTDGVGMPGELLLDDFVRGANFDGFLSTLNTNGTVASTIFAGGGGNDALYDIALQEPGGNVGAYLVGETDSSYPAHNPIAGQSCAAGNKQALFIKYSTAATPRGIYISCLGGSGSDAARGVAVDSSGNAWVTGDTADIAIAGTPLQSAFGGGTADGFVAKIAQTPPTIDSAPAAVISTTTASFSFSADGGMSFECTEPAGGQLAAGTRTPAGCTGNGTTTYSNLIEGTHVFEVVSVDPLNTKSTVTSRSLTVDLTAPAAFGLTSPNEGDTTDKQPTFSWVRAADATDVTYELVIDGQKLQDVPSSACAGDVCSAQAATAFAGGGHKWKVVANDAAVPANKTTSASERSFTVSDPPTAQFVVSPNPVLTGRNASFDASKSAPASNPIARYEWDLDGDGSFETDGGTNAITAKSYTKAGTVNVALRVTDTVGQSGTMAQELRVSDAAPVGSQVGVSINKGAQYTNKPDVTLTIVAPAGVSGLLVANDGGFAGILPSPVSKEVAWKLDSSGPERLPKTVYLRFLTGPFASPNYTDDIILDERPPIVDSASVSGRSAGAATAAKAKTFKVKVKAHDTNSGVGFVQVTANKRKPGKLLKYKKALKVKSAKRPKFLRARDKAGNLSKWKKLR